MRFFEELWIYKDESVWMFTTSVLNGERGRLRKKSMLNPGIPMQATRSDLINAGFNPLGRPHASVA